MHAHASVALDGRDKLVLDGVPQVVRFAERDLGGTLSIFALTAVVQCIALTSPRPAARIRTGSATTRTRARAGVRVDRVLNVRTGIDAPPVVVKDMFVGHPRRIQSIVRILAHAGTHERYWCEMLSSTARRRRRGREPVARHPHSGETVSWAASVVAGPLRPQYQSAPTASGLGEVSSRGTTRTAARAPRAGLDLILGPSVHIALAAGRARQSHNAIPAAGDADRDHTRRRGRGRAARPG